MTARSQTRCLHTNAPITMTALRCHPNPFCSAVATKFGKHVGPSVRGRQAPKHSQPPGLAVRHQALALPLARNSP